MSDNEMYKSHCIKCGTTTDLMMVPNRNGLMQMVGWHFCCPKCLPFIAGKEVETRFGTSYPEGEMN